MKAIFVILSSLFVVCFLHAHSASKQTPKFQENTPLEISSLKELHALLKNQKMVFIDFYSDSCSPCNQFKPVYEAWAGLLGKKIIFIVVNGSNPKTKDLCNKFGVSAFPTLIVLDNQGEEVSKHIGMQEIKQLDIKKFLTHAKD